MASNKKYRRVIFFRHYFESFFIQQELKARQKIIWTLELVEDLSRVPSNYLKCVHSKEKLYEIRIRHGRNIFRLFCFFDTGDVIVIGHGFIKKSQKIPKREIERAIKIKREYEREKRSDNESGPI